MTSDPFSPGRHPLRPRPAHWLSAGTCGVQKGPAGPSGCSARFGHGRGPRKRCPCLRGWAAHSPCGHAGVGRVLGPGSQTRRPAWSLLSSQGERPGASVPGGRWRLLAECSPGPGSSHAAACWVLSARAAVRSPRTDEEPHCSCGGGARPAPGGRVHPDFRDSGGSSGARRTASAVMSPPQMRGRSGAQREQGSLASSRLRGPGHGNFRFECLTSLFPHLRGCFLFLRIYMEIPASVLRVLGYSASAVWRVTGLSVHVAVMGNCHCPSHAGVRAMGQARRPATCAPLRAGAGGRLRLCPGPRGCGMCWP